MCAAVVAGFTACSDSEDIPQVGGETQSGLLTINFKDPATYADDSNNSITEERELRDVTILVFNTQGVCKVDTTITLSELNTTNPGDQQAAINKYKVVNINVPLGLHNVYAGLNLTSGAADKMRETLATNNGVTKYVNLGTATVPAITEINKLSAPGEFPMFSTDVKTINIQPTPASGVNPNHVEIPLDRMVAKITVRKGSDFSAPASLKAAGATFSATDVKWSVGHLNGKIYPYAKANNGQDPNFDYNGSLAAAAGKTYRQQNFVNDFNTLPPAVHTAWKGFDYDVDDNNKVVSERKAKYAPENNSLQKRKGECTYTAIKAKFAPDKIFTFKSGDTAPQEVTSGYTPNINGTETFYVVRHTQIYYFRSTTDANLFRQYLNNSDIHVEAFSGQYCFYHLFMNKGITNRNNFYDIQLNKFTGLGYPQGEIDDNNVDQPVDGQGLLDVTIDINPWVLVPEDYDLE